eukprot:CFRG0247T1
MTLNVLRHGVVPLSTQNTYVHEASFVGNKSPQFHPTNVPHVIVESAVGTQQYIGFVSELNTAIQRDYDDYIHQSWAVTHCLMPCFMYFGSWNLTKNAERIVDHWNDMLFLPAGICVSVHHRTRESGMYLAASDKEPTTYTHHFVWLEFATLKGSSGIIIGDNSRRKLRRQKTVENTSLSHENISDVEIVKGEQVGDTKLGKRLQIVRVASSLRDKGQHKKSAGSLVKDSPKRAGSLTGSGDNINLNVNTDVQAEEQADTAVGEASLSDSNIPGNLDSWMSKIEKKDAENAQAYAEFRSTGLPSRPNRPRVQSMGVHHVSNDLNVCLKNSDSEAVSRPKSMHNNLTSLFPADKMKNTFRGTMRLSFRPKKSHHMMSTQRRKSISFDATDSLMVSEMDLNSGVLSDNGIAPRTVKKRSKKTSAAKGPGK